MKYNIDLVTKKLQNSELFKNIPIKELNKTLSCLNPTMKVYNKNDIIISQGSTLKNIGIILKGSINHVRTDYNGNESIIDSKNELDLFLHSIIFSDLKITPISCVARENCHVLFFSFDRLIDICNKRCETHLTIYHNLLKIVSKNNVTLNKKIEILSAKTIREKIIIYFNHLYIINNSLVFQAPYNKTNLSEFLGINRSVLSRELSQLKTEKKLDYKGNFYYILDKEYFNCN